MPFSWQRAAPFAGAALLFTFLHFVPAPARPILNLCGFHWLTGRPCPLCGLTRGLFALAKGRLTEAEHLNALTPLGFAMLFSLFWNFSWREWLWRIGSAAFAVYGAIRLAMPQ